MDANRDEDIIVVHLGRILPEKEYEKVVASVIAFMNARWPGGKIKVDN